MASGVPKKETVYFTKTWVGWNGVLARTMYKIGTLLSYCLAERDGENAEPPVRIKIEQAA